MANNTLDAQHEAMAAESSADGEKTRKSPIKGAYLACLAMVTASREAWAKDEDATDESREVACNVLDKIAAQIQKAHDEHTSDAENLGKHYVGVTPDGKRAHVQSVTPPTAKRFPQFARVVGPFSRLIAADFRVEKGLQGGETIVFETK